MGLRAVFLDLKGIIINDESIHQELIADLLLGENLRSDNYDFQRFCLGRSDRACLKDILKIRGRIVTDDYLTKLIDKKTQAYQQKLSQLEALPIYPNLNEFLSRLQQQQLIIGLVTGALKQEATLILEKTDLAQYFSIIIAGDDLALSKPEPDSYLLVIESLNQQNPNLHLQPSECLAIESTYVGIEAAKKAQMQVVGISRSHPLHMLQRRANWTVDSLAEIEIERVDRVLSNFKSA